ncbi:hypothetical protein C8R47DRAFT_970601, partial [Mycena vitilis]
QAFIGLLTGDPASPILWNLFLADLSMMPDSDDVFLASIRISLLAQADDLLIVPLSVRGLQAKLSTLGYWRAKNFILVNLIKTIILIYGALLSPPPTFHLGLTQISVTSEEKYVGVNLRTDTRNMFADHYKAKARTARYCGHRIFAIEDMTGGLTQKELKPLLMGRVDCHLTHGCEISPDSEDVHVKQLCKVQVTFIRRMLNLHRRSMIAPLFTETGIMPLRVRRLLLTLSHLRHFLDLKDDHLARAALNSSFELAGNGKKSWAQDLIKAATRLPFQCPELILTRQTASEDIEDFSEVVEKVWLQSEIDSSDKLYLLHGRREPQKDKGPAQVTSCMRHYLTHVKTRKHREAITSVLLSTHLLAVEILRYVDHAYPAVPRSDRLCRFCRSEVETPEYALITCAASATVVTLRAKLLADLFIKLPELQTRMAELSDVDFLKAIVYPRSSIALVAKFMYEVLEVFYAVPVFRLNA